MNMNRIKELRKQKNMTQKELAKHLKIADSTLSYWEMGRYEPDSEALLMLSRFFQVPIDYILKGDFLQWDINTKSVQHQGIDAAHEADSDMFVSEVSLPYNRTNISTAASNTINNQQGAQDGFDRAEFEGLTQSEIESLAEYALFIKSRRNNRVV